MILSRGMIRRIIRISWITAGLTLLSAVFIHLMVIIPAPAPKSLEVVQAKEANDKLKPFRIPSFADLNVGRDIFEFVSISLHKETFKKETPIKDKPPPPPPKPDTSGLRLLGTIVGDGSTGAIIEEEEAGRQHTIPLGGKIRQSFISEIAADHIELTRGKEKKVLHLWRMWQNELDALETKLKVPIPKKKQLLVQRTDTPLKDISQTVTISGSLKPEQRHLGLSVRIPSSLDLKKNGINSGGLIVTESSRPDVDIKAGDFIMAIDGQEIFSIQQVVQLVNQTKNKSVRLSLINNGEKKEVEVPLYY